MRVAGTGQAVVSRIEAGRLNPTVEMLHRLAEARQADLELTLVPYEMPRHKGRQEPSRSADERRGG